MSEPKSRQTSKIIKIQERAKKKDTPIFKLTCELVASRSIKFYQTFTFDLVTHGG